jgi:hypothetical protein
MRATRSRTITSLLAAVGAGFAVSAMIGAPSAVANPNPSGTGQPNQSIEDPANPLHPSGFDTTGFANAAQRYAGSPGTPSLAHGNAHAVSQYDVAGYQVSHNGASK